MIEIKRGRERLSSELRAFLGNPCMPAFPTVPAVRPKVTFRPFEALADISAADRTPQRSYGASRA